MAEMDSLTNAEQLGARPMDIFSPATTIRQLSQASASKSWNAEDDEDIGGDGMSTDGSDTDAGDVSMEEIAQTQPAFSQPPNPADEEAAIKAQEYRALLASQPLCPPELAQFGFTYQPALLQLLCTKCQVAVPHPRNHLTDKANLHGTFTKKTLDKAGFDQILQKFPLVSQADLPALPLRPPAIPGLAIFNDGFSCPHCPFAARMRETARKHLSKCIYKRKDTNSEMVAGVSVQRIFAQGKHSNWFRVYTELSNPALNLADGDLIEQFGFADDTEMLIASQRPFHPVDKREVPPHLLTLGWTERLEHCDRLYVSSLASFPNVNTEEALMQLLAPIVSSYFDIALKHLKQSLPYDMKVFIGTESACVLLCLNLFRILNALRNRDKVKGFKDVQEDTSRTRYKAVLVQLIAYIIRSCGGTAREPTQDSEPYDTKVTAGDYKEAIEHLVETGRRLSNSQEVDRKNILESVLGMIWPSVSTCFRIGCEDQDIVSAFYLAWALKDTGEGFEQPMLLTARIAAVKYLIRLAYVARLKHIELSVQDPEHKAK